MTVLDLIKKSAVILNIDEISSGTSLNTVTPENEATILQENFALNRLFELVKVMLNEIATYYLPIVKTVKVSSQDREIALTACPNYSRIVGVKLDDVFVKFNVGDNSIDVEEDGEYEVTYHQTPVITSLFCDIALDGVSEDLLIDGLNAYYCLACGLFSEFNNYNHKYSSKLAKLRQLPIFSMPRRSWQ